MIKKSVLGILFILSAFIVTSLYVLFGSQEGIRLCILAADRFLPGQLSVESVHGRLANTFTLEGLRYSYEANDIAIDLFSLSWQPVSLLQKKLQIGSFEMKGSSIVLEGDADDIDESPSAWNAPLPSFTLPLSIQIQKGSVESLTIVMDKDSPPFEVSTFAVEDFSGTEDLFQVGNCAVTTGSYRIVVNGQLQTGDMYLTTLNVDYFVEREGVPPIDGNVVLDGSFDELAYEAHSVTPFNGTFKGIVYDLTGDIHWKGDLLTDKAALFELGKDWPEILFTDFQASGEGTLSTYSVLATSVATYGSLQDVAVTANLKGDGSGLQILAAQFRDREAILSGNGHLSWENEFSWKADLSADNVALSELGKNWPEIMFTDFQASGEGILSTYSIQATTVAAYGSVQDVAVTANLKGDGSGLQILAAQLRDREAILSGNGHLSWEDEFSWKADIRGNQIDPTIFNEQWPGRLNLELFTTGRLRNDEMDAVVDLHTLDGELRGFPLTANGKIEKNGNEFTFDAFNLQSADSILQASGRLTESYDLDFKLESPDLVTLWPDLSGSIKAAGQISGTRQQPHFQFDLEGNNLIFEETQISDLAASGTGELIPEGSIHVLLSAKEVTVAETTLDTISADIKGTTLNHTFETQVTGQKTSGTFKFEGAYADNRWNGRLSEGAVETERIKRWQLKSPAQLALSSESAVIERLCLTGTQSALICIDGTYEQDGQWRAKADLISIPVDMFSDLQNRIRKLNGSLTGKVNMKGQGAGITEGSLNIVTENVSVELDISDDYHREIVWEENIIQATLAGNTVNAEMKSMLQDGSSITSEAVVNDIEMIPFSIEHARVKGKANIRIKDLQPLSALSYPTVDPSGSLKGTMEFSGKLLQPDFIGNIKLDNGKMIVPSLGITINDVEMNVDGKNDKILFQATAYSGSGTLRGEGVYQLFPRERNQPVEMHITGDNFEIINIKEAKINVSPDLKVKISKEQGEINGKILVTEAIITLQNLSGAVSPSRDIVLVRDGMEQKNGSWPFFADVAIIAGENVRINAFGLRGRMQGQLKIIDQPTRPLIGEGTLEVREGTFSIYGRQLQIVKGKLIFSGSYLDNPGIEVRAENSTGGVTTGIQVSGLLQKYDVSFYSTPTMEENEIIQRLLTNTSLIGSSEDEGFIDSVTSDTGIGAITSAAMRIKEGLRVDDIKLETGDKSDDLSLVIGTWVTPELYVSYGKNLIKESGSFNTRYKLGRGFSFVTETGAAYNSFDFIYEIDK